MAQGKVKWFDDAKGYGFIEAEENNEQLFVHYTKILVISGRRTLRVGQIVNYSRVHTQRGPAAEDVKVQAE